MRRTKRKNTDPGREEVKREAVRSVVIQALLQLLGAGLLLGLRARLAAGWAGSLLLALAVADLSSIPFMLPVLRERLREIEKGELDEARKY